MISNLAESVREFENALSGIVSTLNRAMHHMVRGAPDYTNGEHVSVMHEDLSFHGHICEHRTENTVTVARSSDGVLVTVPRSSVRRMSNT